MSHTTGPDPAGGRFVGGWTCVPHTVAGCAAAGCPPPRAKSCAASAGPSADCPYNAEPVTTSITAANRLDRLNMRATSPFGGTTAEDPSLLDFRRLGEPGSFERAQLNWVIEKSRNRVMELLNS